MKYASLAILAYKRPTQFKACIDSLHETLDYPAEIIVNVDATVEPDTAVMAAGFLANGKISKLIINRGENRGVGRSFQNCYGMAEGDYIFKIDTDLTFKPHWLSTAVGILEGNTDVGTVSLFDYKHYNPTEKRFNHLEERSHCFIVDDFVSSIYGFRSHPLPELPKNIPDDGMHQILGKMAITKEDFCDNSGFGIGKSTYVVADKNGNPVKAETHDKPLIFHEKT